MQMQNLHFNADVVPGNLRSDAWSEFLSELMLKFEAREKSAPRLGNSGWKRTSTLQSVHAEVRSPAQVLFPDAARVRAYSSQGGQLVLIVKAHEGNGYVRTSSDDIPFSGDQVLILDPTQEWRIDFTSAFHATLICLKGASLLLRLLRSIPEGYTLLQREEGMARAIFALLDANANGAGDIPPEELSQIEVALEGLLLSTVAKQKGPREETVQSHLRSSSTQLHQLKRICKTIELKLPEPQFSLQELAAVEKLSVRYIQKLFLTLGTTFSHYLRRRRLERCRMDLADSCLMHLTILEICGRWGFTDAANFSRAFSQEYHITPREWRATPKHYQASMFRGSPVSARFEVQELLDWSRLDGLVPDSEDRQAADAVPARISKYHHVPATCKTIHWGYFCKSIRPVLTVDSGDFVTIETITQHAYDDYELMIKGDSDAEGIFQWDQQHKSIDRRGAGPIDSSIYGRGPGEGFGVHICTGPVLIKDAQPGDMLEIRILDIGLRPSATHPNKTFGSNAATWWGYQYHDLITAPKQREVVTIYQIEETGYEKFAEALYSYRWTPQTDPAGVRHELIDYPGIPVDHSTIVKNTGILEGVRIPVRPHFGVIAVAPEFDGAVDSVPPGAFGGNIDNWRASAGSSVFLPVQVAGALLSIGDPHVSQGDAEVCGTAIECSLTGKFQLLLHKKQESIGLFDLDFPFIETEDEWVILGFSYSNYLVELGQAAQSDVYKKSTLDLAMRDAFRKTRKFLMVQQGLSEDEAVSLMSVAIDFGITQLVNGNIGIHAVIKKAIFQDSRSAH